MGKHEPTTVVTDAAGNVTDVYRSTPREEEANRRVFDQNRDRARRGGPDVVTR